MSIAFIASMGKIYTLRSIFTRLLVVSLGRCPLRPPCYILNNGKQTGLKNGVRTAIGYSVRGVAKAGSATIFTGLPTAGRFLKGGLLAGAGALAGSEDYTLRSLGNAINMADAGIKTAKVGVKAGAKATGYTVKTGVKAGKGALAGSEDYTLRSLGNV